MLAQLFLGLDEERVHVRTGPLELKTGDDMRLIRFLVERRQRNEKISRLQAGDARERFSDIRVVRQPGKRLRQKCLHVRLGPDFIEVGRLPVGHRLLEVRYG